MASLLEVVRAVIAGKTEMVRGYLAAGGSPSEVYEGRNLLHWAVQEGKLSVARLLLSAGALPNLLDDHGFHSLQTAAGANHPRVLSLLIKWGADVNLRCADQSTALHTAAAYGNLNIARMLLAAGADVDLFDHHGYTPLMYAIENKQIELIPTLLAFGADPEANVLPGFSARSLAKKKGVARYLPKR